MKKKLLSVLLALCMVSGTVMSPVSMENVRAEESDITKKTSEGFEYEIRNVYDDDEEEIIGEVVGITNYSGIDTHVVIPEEIEGLEVVALEVGYENSTIQTIHIPYTVTSIYGLRNCNNLTTITVDENNAEFSSVDGILYNKEKTEILSCPVGIEGEVNIPETVTNIGDYTFSECIQLTKVNLSESTERIGYAAFAGCTSLASFYIPQNVTEIDDNAFSRSFGMTEITVDDANAIYASEDGILYDKEKTLLLDVPQGKEGVVNIPTGVAEIDYSAFGGCKNITKIVLPDSLTSIGYCAFMGCGVKEIEIPNSVTFIDEFTFAQCKELEKVTLPNSFTRITGQMFSDCEKLETLSIPKNVTRIGFWSFNNCSKLTSIRIPKSLEYIAEAFGGCTSLADIYYEGSEEEWNKITIESTSNEALFNATIHYNSEYPKFEYDIVESDDEESEKTIRIKKYIGEDSVVEIPEEIEGLKVVEIGDAAFAKCAQLTEINLPESVERIGESAFAGCTSLTSFHIPKNVIEIGYNAFSRSLGMTEITVDDENEVYASVDGILYNKEKTLLIDVPQGKVGVVNVPDGVTTIGESSFGGCKKITEVILPDTVITLDSFAFYGCAMKNIQLPDGLTTIEGSAFSSCEELVTITLPDKVEILSLSTFIGCVKLKSINFPRRIQEIPSAFDRCTELMKIWIPSNITSISDYAFYQCNNLKDIYYEGSEADWDKIEINSEYNENILNATVHYNFTYEDFVGTDKIPENPQPEIPPVTTPDTESNEKVEDTKEPEITTIALDSVAVSKEKTTYNGKSQTPSITVTDANGQPVDAANYTVTYTNNKNVGQATVTVTGTNSYTGTLTVTFKILPKGTSLSKVTAKKKAFIVKWKKQTKQTTGYQLAYSTNKNFKGAKTITVKKNKTTSDTVKKLKAKKKYYVRIRTYKTVKINGKSTKLYSEWSKPKTVKTKK